MARKAKRIEYDYPCDSHEIVPGDIIVTKDGRRREVERTDGKSLYFTDKNMFFRSHPDIFKIIPKEEKKPAVASEQEE